MQLTTHTHTHYPRHLDGVEARERHKREAQERGTIERHKVRYSRPHQHTLQQSYGREEVVE